MKLNAQRHEPGRCSDGSEIARIAAQFRLIVLDDAGVSEGRDLAARLLQGAVAPTEAFLAVRRAAASAMLGFREQGVLTGLLAAFPLNARGHDKLKSGTFDAINLDAALVCWEGETPEAYYGWGFVASTKEAGRAVLQATAALHQALFYATPTYARAVTSDGMRALTSLGFRAPSWSDGRLLLLEPRQPGHAR